MLAANLPLTVAPSPPGRNNHLWHLARFVQGAKQLLNLGDCCDDLRGRSERTNGARLRRMF